MDRRSRILRSRSALVGGVAAALGLCLLSGPDAVSAASPVGSQFQVNTYTTNGQGNASVASDSSGNFVVVWLSSEPSSSVTYPSMQSQRYDASGSAIGAQFQVNTYMTRYQTNPSVASDPAGNFFVVWQSYGSAGSDTSGYSVQGRRYDASGSAIGTQFQVNTYTTGNQRNSSVASDSSGNFVVVWDSNGSAGSDTSSLSVQGRRYDASGSAIGPQFQVNTFRTSAQKNPSVASDPAGNFVVVWESYGSFGSYGSFDRDDSDTSVQGQRYDASGSAIGNQFQVNTYTTSFQRNSSVAIDPAGNFVVVWQSYGSFDSDTSSLSVQGQRYDASGARIGGEFQVNTYTTNGQGNASVASDSSGNFVVVWSGGSAASVQGQCYDASGAPIGGEFQVNTYTTGGAVGPSVASDSSGNFVVVWTSGGSAGSDTSSSSVQGQRYLPEPSFVSSLGAMLAMLVALARRPHSR